MITIDQVKESLKNKNPLIEWAVAYSRSLRLHVNGDKNLLDSFLKRINSYENERQFEARQKHAISNKFITEELLRPVDNAFSAKGGSKNYIFSSGQDKKEIQFVEKLMNVKNGLSLSEFIENIWFNKFVTDPNGLIMVETREEAGEAQLTYKSIECIRDYQQNGINIDWVIFEPHLIFKEDGKEIKLFIAIDEQNYYTFKLGEEVALIGERPHGFDKVPAILASNLVHNVTGWKKSPIDAQLELLDKYVVSNSVLSIAEFFHNYPQEYTYVGDCPRCEGSGVVPKYEIRPGLSSTECTKCEGTGQAERKDVTDIIKLKIPEEGDTKIDPPSGFIFMPTEPWKLMTDSVDRTFKQIYFSHWNTSVDREGKNETATGRFLDAQPVNNRLDKYSRSMEIAHSALANFLGEFYFSETFQKAIIQYGRRYLIETPDQIWEKYLKAKKDNAPIGTLDLLLFQFIESEFKGNEHMFIFEFKKMVLEPFVHWDIETVRKSQTINS